MEKGSSRHQTRGKTSLSSSKLTAGLSLAFALTLLGACGQDSTSPTGSSNEVWLVLVSDGPFTIDFQGQTITAEGVFPFQLAPGSYELSGTMRTNTLGISFSRNPSTPGGVESGSVRSLAGPAVDQSPCMVTYVTFSPPSSLRMQFSVTSSATRSCQ